MSINVSWRGINYTIPEPGDANTQSLTDYLNALSTGAVPFPTTADIDLGASFGLKALYLKTRSANPAGVGLVREAVGDVLAWRNNANSGDLQLGVNGSDQLTFASVPIAHTAVTVTYSASMTPNAAQGDHFIITATNGTAFTINNPTNAVAGQPITIEIRNTSGGALGVATFGGLFKMAAWVQPGNTAGRSISFRYDGTNWKEISRCAADIPN